ncbi:guanylate kinase [Lapidilactobacillus dextrinicus]|uniref:guanylate kinase n=1 Tax=Lapidilactobacillus dextrinicus TaxID=51664 RepID=UPI0022DFB8E0|nr:AAA family ATPase [Lapidilactobacillus dextrinicus]
MSKTVANKLFIITGASGTGKTTISHYLRDNYGIQRVITHTTRPPRANELDGRDYYFETEASFKQNHYIEAVSYSGYHYGSSREALQKAWHKQPFVSLVVETKGAEAYAQVMPQQIVVLFITVSNPEVLLPRLEARGDQPVEIEKRLASAESKRDLQVPAALKSIAKVINNDHWATAKQQIDEIIKTEIRQNCSQ